MRAKEIINELGNASYPYVEPFPGEYSVALPTGKELYVTIMPDTMLNSDSTGFAYQDGLNIEFALDGEYALTGTGDQFRILATVMKIVRNHLPQLAAPEDVRFVRFTADSDEPSRVSLYQRAAPKIGQILQAMPVQWRFSERPGRSVSFLWTKEDNDEGR